MTRLFLDTNFLLDLIDTQRRGHPSALKVEALMEQENLHGLIAWHSLSIIDYVGGRKFGRERIQQALQSLLEVFTVPQTGTEDARAAFPYLSSDYEDALQISAAVAGNADVIVTRDKSGFTNSPVKVLTPEELLVLAALPAK